MRARRQAVVIDLYPVVRRPIPRARPGVDVPWWGALLVALATWGVAILVGWCGWLGLNWLEGFLR